MTFLERFRENVSLMMREAGGIIGKVVAISDMDEVLVVRFLLSKLWSDTLFAVSLGGKLSSEGHTVFFLQEIVLSVMSCTRGNGEGVVLYEHVCLKNKI